MAITTYAGLVSKVRQWLGRDNDTTYLSDDQIDDFIVAAETEIYDQLRVDALEGESVLTVDAQRIALPDALIEMRRVFLDGTPLVRMEYRTPSQFWVEAGANVPGRPKFYTIEGNTIVFGPSPDATYTARIWGYLRPSPLSVATNSIFLARPTMFLFGALKHAAMFTGMDPAEPQGRAAMWAAAFANAIQDVQSASDRGTYSATPLTIRPG